jgi:transcriptional regulator
MARKSRADARGDMLQGTLDMLILRTLLAGPAHGHTIAHVIEKSSDEILQVEHGSLYPALHRLENQGLIAAFWGTSENNRKAKYYRMTPSGRHHLLEERSRWSLLVDAVARVLGPATD